MPRPAKIWQRDQDSFFYCTHRGKQVRLARDRKEAEKAFHEMKARPDEAPEAGSRPSFRKLADLYLEFMRQSKDKKTFDHRLFFLKSFAAHVKAKKAAELKPGDVTNWILGVNAAGKKPRWGHNTQVTARGIVTACLNWAVGEGHLPYSPLAKMKVGSFHRRERMLTRDERDRIKAAVTYAPFGNLLAFLEQTGCRPFSEASSLTASMIDWPSGTITFHKHKNARKGKTRVVYLVPALQEQIKAWCAETPEGPLFRTHNGIAYNRSNVVSRIRYLERSLGMPRWSLYAFRHAFFTEALERGVPSDLLAEIGGNTPKTIAKYYNHLDQRKDALRAAALKAVS